MKKNIVVEWFRYEKEGATCCRCGDSTEVVRRVVAQFRKNHVDVDVELREHSLDESDIGLSNTVKINGRDLTEIVGERGGVLTDCPSCTELIGIETLCNTFSYKGGVYDSLPEEMLTEALNREASGGDSTMEAGPSKG